MEYLNEENMVHLAGKVLSEPVFSHKTCGEAFYLTVMGILRRSGYEGQDKGDNTGKAHGGAYAAAG